MNAAIITKSIGQVKDKIKATCQAGSITVSSIELSETEEPKPMRYLVRIPADNPTQGLYGHKRAIVTGHTPRNALMNALAYDRDGKWKFTDFVFDKHNQTPTSKRFNNKLDSRACAYVDIQEDN